VASVKDIAWAAGFLEGEGWFGCAGKNSLACTCCQVQEQPLRRLQEIFGGNIQGPIPKRDNPKHSPFFRWAKCGHSAAGMMMTLYCLMSPKRQEQIRTALAKWKVAAGPPGSRRFCPNGHEYSGSNLVTRYRQGRSKPGRYCRECMRDACRRYEAKRKGKVSSAIRDRFAQR
jgi:hypothetical protein